MPLTFAPFYEIKTTLGRGGQACVYRATDRRTNKEVAIKHFHMPDDPELVWMINQLGAQEAKVLKVLGKGPPELWKSIPRLYATGYEEHMSYLVMEYIPWPTLAAYSKKRLEENDPWTAGEWGNVLLRIATLCDTIHRQQVIIRDIKPSNILIDPGTLDVALIDFSIALYLPYKRFWSPYSLICCSEGYVPPEIKTPQIPIAPSYDCYSFGCLLRNCAEWVNASLPSAYYGLVAQLLQEDPLKRPSMSEAHSILNSLFGVGEQVIHQVLAGSQ